MLSLGRSLVIAAVAGLALDVAFPALGWWPLAFPAIALALISLRGRSFWGAVLAGFVYGVAFYFHMSPGPASSSVITGWHGCHGSRWLRRRHCSWQCWLH